MHQHSVHSKGHIEPWIQLCKHCSSFQGIGFVFFVVDIISTVQNRQQHMKPLHELHIDSCHVREDLIVVKQLSGSRTWNEIFFFSDTDIYLLITLLSIVIKDI